MLRLFEKLSSGGRSPIVVVLSSRRLDWRQDGGGGGEGGGGRCGWGELVEGRTRTSRRLCAQGPPATFQRMDQLSHILKPVQRLGPVFFANFFHRFQLIICRLEAC